MLGSRPNLAYSVGFLTSSLQNPTVEDVTRVNRVFRYIVSTLEFGIVYNQSAKKGVLEFLSNADFESCSKIVTSTSGILMKYADDAVLWLSQHQSTLSESTSEAETIAATEEAKEAVWFRRIFEEFTSTVYQ